MKQFTSIDPRKINQKKQHEYLLSSVCPRPICFASTVDKKGNVNLSPFSFFNVVSSNPPILIFSPARRGTDNTQKHTLTNMLEVEGVVIHIIDYPLVEQMSLTNTPYKKGINEFVKTGLTPLKSNLVRPPRVQEAPFAFECKVKNVIALGDKPGAGNLVLAEVLQMHFHKNYLDQQGNLTPEKMEWVARMGGNWYAKITKEELFEIPKPNSKIGIGVDQLPISAQKSRVLSGNNLGRLGNKSRKPKPSELDQLKNAKPIKTIVATFHGEKRIEQLHALAKKELERNNEDKALRLVFLAEQL